MGEIARGGMGRVYAGHDRTLDREVAIKTLLPGANAQRFVIEAKITAKLPHPGIPPVYALGTLANGSPYLAMKLIRGRTLAELLKERPSPLDELPRFVQIFEQIAQAVGFAHAQGIMHRDLKPANVMVGMFGEVQVMDWGLAKDVASGEPQRREELPTDRSEARTVAGTVMGTPGFMAPEQARGEVVDVRADVFALGATLAAILTGQPAFVAGTVQETIEKAARAELADVRQRLTKCGADGELIALAILCLSADAARRPADGQEVASLAATYRSGVEARLKQAQTERAEAVVREAEQRKRRRTVQAAGGVIAVVLLAGMGVSMWQRCANEKTFRSSSRSWKPLFQARDLIIVGLRSHSLWDLVRGRRFSLAEPAKVRSPKASVGATWRAEMTSPRFIPCTTAISVRCPIRWNPKWWEVATYTLTSAVASKAGRPR
jgi:serine/threonine protein kinase